MMTFTDVQKAHCTRHETAEIDCVDCTVAQQNAACDHLTLTQKAKKFKAAKRSASVTASARPVAVQTITHVAGDVETRRLNEVVDTAQGGTQYTENVRDYANAKFPQQAALADEGGNFVAAPAHLSTAKVAKGFILAGNAVFTVRSLKTGVRYTYRVSRAECSRCRKKDCQCWKYPTYFVALLTGPDNQGDYTYLGMIRENAFRLTRGSRMLESSKPVLAFRYVWERLAGGEYPPQVEIWHEGRCGVCARPLTVPESIASGIGPVCAGKGGL